jgi:hypothetical protein
LYVLRIGLNAVVDVGLVPLLIAKVQAERDDRLKIVVVELVSRLVQQQERVRSFALDLSPTSVPGAAPGSAAGMAAVGLVPALIAIITDAAKIPPPSSPNAPLIAVCCKVCSFNPTCSPIVLSIGTHSIQLLLSCDQTIVFIIFGDSIGRQEQMCS